MIWFYIYLGIGMVYFFILLYRYWVEVRSYEKYLIPAFITMFIILLFCWPVFLYLEIRD
jgi:hypothetical protein